MRRSLFFALAFMAATVRAADDNAPRMMEAPVPPPMPENVELGDQDYEPEVTIRDEADKTVTEYRVNGRLYMIKVQPSSGPAYYLSDTDGDGNLETKQEELDPGFLVPKWILFSW